MSKTTEVKVRKPAAVSAKKGALIGPEIFLWNAMKTPDGAVPYIEAEPGTAKSAIGASIASKKNLLYIDIRLAQSDETDTKMPFVYDLDGVKVTGYTVPDWAIEANNAVANGYDGALIHWEELNRCRKEIQDAALGILNERCIGTKFRFNNNVYMMASGNLGEEDGTNVEEMDAALATRLAIKRHVLTFDFWYENFAKENVLPIITAFLRAKPTYFFHRATNDRAYANARTWTRLSNYLKSTYGNNPTPNDYLTDVGENAVCFIGSAAATFMRYVQDQMQLSVRDILERYSEIEKDISRMAKGDRSKIDELMNEIQLKRLRDYSASELVNVAKFLKHVDEDKLADYFMKEIKAMDTEDFEEEKIKTFMGSFSKFAEILEKHWGNV
jgi:hypothetical protein